MPGSAVPANATHLLPPKPPHMCQTDLLPLPVLPPGWERPGPCPCNAAGAFDPALPLYASFTSERACLIHSVGGWPGVISRVRSCRPRPMWLKRLQQPLEMESELGPGAMGTGPQAEYL
ncbi:hypothetical protein NDU88_001394 [Pleurodeles waltl]|uniref:Uncharacterized protein n=1 Tax=Pleurodeles waltl TaxID=8319 RepID=A0AAV7KPH0_PLEWA|nr:hypothetical protein NDU88_001394 [Pleurodeles waltl]